jgi:DNA segregation ATPase FtsK/SpoIIIE-like protein
MTQTLASAAQVSDVPRRPWPPALTAPLEMSETVISKYVDKESQQLLTLNRSPRLELNPFMEDWLKGRGFWPGISWNKTAMRAVVGLVDDPHNARQVPLTVNFTRGHAVIFGASGWGKSTFLRSLVLSLATTHSPNELHVHIFDLGGRSLAGLKDLPHVGTLIVPDERGYEERIQQLLRELTAEIDERKRLLGARTLYEYNSREAKPKPAILVLIDNFSEYIETFGANAQPNDTNNLFNILIGLIRQGKAYGLHFVVTANRLNVLSSKLYSLFTERFTLRLSDSGDYIGIVGSQMPDIEEISGRGYVQIGRMPLSFQVALVTGAIEKIDEEKRASHEVDQILALGKCMHTHMREANFLFDTKPLSIDALPDSSSFRTLLAEEHPSISLVPGRFIETLKTTTEALWLQNTVADNSDWLKAPLGIVSGNRRRMLRLEAKRDGVHGMIAGGTGSGKSELLMTMIVSLALRYSPDILNFVLVDYKGGGAFKPFEGLPHCVDIVTNLNKAAVARMFTSINAEIRRRQALNTRTGTKDIIDYRRKGLHLSGDKYPHLFIIIDEYAEMIQENDKYLHELESITRVGRAQGVNLILASQQPKGVTDQMRANIKLRLCLRVEQMDTSRELLRRPDAALLPNGMPGRGYLQIGNENIELIQVSYTGEKQEDDREHAVIWPDRADKVSVGSDEEPPKLFDMAVRLASELWERKMAPKPWPAFLPDYFSLESPLTDAKRGTRFTLQSTVTDWINGDVAALWQGVDWQHKEPQSPHNALNPIIGLIDDPVEASQEPLRIDFSRSHLVVFGDSGMGKTMLLRTLLISLVTVHSPDELHLYILDLGGRNFRSFEKLPHVGAIISATEEAFEMRFNRLLGFLNQTIMQRQQSISASGATNLPDFNARFPEQALPAILVMIDNFAELEIQIREENYDTLVDNKLLPLLRSALNVGIFFIVTANLPNNLPNRLYVLFNERMTFKQTETDRYIDIVGRGAVEIGDVPGRGFKRKDQKALLFHAALPLGFLDKEGRLYQEKVDAMQLLTTQMETTLKVRGRKFAPPVAVEALPPYVSLTQLLQAEVEKRPQKIEAIVGQQIDLSAARFDLKKFGPHFIVVGPPFSGKTTALYNWTFSLAKRYAPSQVKFILVDMQGKFFNYGGSLGLASLPHVLACISEVEQLELLLPNIKAECEVLSSKANNSALFVIVDNFDDFNEEIGQRQLGKELAGLVRRYGRDGLHFVISSMPRGESSPLKQRILSSRYGISLRTREALEVLSPNLKTPPALRDKELPTGRGFIIDSGQATLIQCANPYTDVDGVTSPNQAEDKKKIIALDNWVANIRDKYPNQWASWASIEPVAKSPQTDTAKTQRMLAILQAGMRKELEQLQGANTSARLVTLNLVLQDVNKWTDEEVLTNLLRELYVQQQGGGNEYLEKMAKRLAAKMDVDILLQTFEGKNQE